MKPSEFREGLAKAIYEATWPNRPCTGDQADAVIAYLETADLIYVENDNGELIGWPLADWLKEGKA